MRDGRQGMLTGRAGEYAVAAQLLLRGVSVFLPAVDEGADLMVENGCRIQVKSAHLYNNAGSPCYFFPLPKNRRRALTDKTATLRPKKPFAEICDYVVFWGIEQNRFWIVPASMCDECTGVELGADLKLGKRFVGSIKDMREMIALGYKRGQVAKHYGIQRHSLQQFLDSGKDFIDESVSSKMRACEGRWDFIADFVRSAVANNAPAKVEEE